MNLKKPLPGTDSLVPALFSALPLVAGLAVCSVLTYHTGSWPGAASPSVGWSSQIQTSGYSVTSRAQEGDRW